MEYWILALPYLLFFLTLLVFGLLCFKKWKWVIALLALMLVLNLYGEVFALHPFLTYLETEQEEDLKVMTFNIYGAGDDFEKRIDGIASLIKKEDPDVVFLCELFSPIEHHQEHLDSLLKLSYRFSSIKDKIQKGNVIYCKYPIDTIKVINLSLGKCLPLATIDVNEKKISLLGCHLSSNNYIDSQTRLEVEVIATKRDAMQYLEALEKGYQARREDVDSLGIELKAVNKSHLIVLGDMNDIGGSYTIRTLEALGLYDAWWNGSFGLGGTRKVLGMPFRIDHILYGNGFRLKETTTINADGLSDHDALVARFCIK